MIYTVTFNPAIDYVMKLDDLDVYKRQGYDGAERNICVFLPQWQESQDWISSEYCPLRVLRCFWPKEIELTHRDFLGAVLSLGIDREKIGDILVRDDKCDIITVSYTHLVVTYGVNINAIAKSIVSKVKYTVEDSTGIVVEKVIVHIDGMKSE